MQENNVRIRTAVFVDFDNMFNGLYKKGREIAESFGKEVDLWDKWLEQELPYLGKKPALGFRRDILLRRCYLNPEGCVKSSSLFQTYRSYFTLAAYQVIDCPPLTKGGKASTDIHMVMDIIDAINHPTRFDEFILLSSDADFTPVLMRLRSHDRRTTVIKGDDTSKVYKNSCDQFIDEYKFIENALDFIPESEIETENVSNSIEKFTEYNSEEVLYQIAEKCHERTFRFRKLDDRGLDIILNKFQKSNNWFGLGTRERFLERLVMLKPSLILRAGVVYLDSTVNPIIGISEPVNFKLSGEIINRVTSTDNSVPEDFLRRLHRVVGVPFLDANTYTTLFQLIYEVVGNGFSSITETSQTVWDRCENSIRRQDVNFVLIEMNYSEAFSDLKSLSCPEDVARVFLDSLFFRCERIRIELSEDEKKYLRELILGKVKLET